MTADASRLREQPLIFRVGDEGQIAGGRVLQTGDAHDLEIAVTFETTLEPFSEMSRSFKEM